MGYFLKNFHIVVFAFFSLAAAVWVGSNPERAVALAEPVVADAVELQQMAAVISGNVEKIDWQTSGQEAITLYIAAMRMPSMLFERLEQRVVEVQDRMREAGVLAGPDKPGKKLSMHQAMSVLKDLQSAR